MSNNKVKIYTLGCKVNQYDSLNLKRRLELAGAEPINKNADWAIINTCAVTWEAIKKDRRMVARSKKENPKAKLILMGCLPEAYWDEAKKIDADYIFGVGDTSKIIELLNLSPKEIGIPKLKISKSNRSRYFIKIQDGCEQFCSYCIIPYTRGNLKSRGEEEIISEIKEALKSGYREIVLTGIHLGLFGQGFLGKRDRVLSFSSANSRPKKKSRLVELVKKIIEIKNLGRIRLSSLEITEVDDELIKLIARENKICNHLHIPLQSGSDKILKLMNRPYTSAIFKRKIRKIRKLIPEIAISTDVIVGFPGESDENFKETYNFIKKIKFSRLHIFPFSAHEKTPAFKFPNKVKQGEIKKRAKKLRSLGEKLKKEYKDKFLGRELEVVVENRRKGKCLGKSEYYFDVEFRDNNYKPGEIVKIKLN